MEPPPLAEAAGLREGRAWAGTNLALEAGNRRGLGSGRNWGDGGERGTARERAQGGWARPDGRLRARRALDELERESARGRIPPPPRPVCACAGARSAPPSTWDCALGPAVLWEL